MARLLSSSNSPIAYSGQIVTYTTNDPNPALRKIIPTSFDNQRKFVGDKIRYTCTSEGSCQQV